MENTASLAVNLSPLVNVALSTSSNVYTLPFSDSVQDFASAGTMSPSGPIFTSVSYTLYNSTCGIATPSWVVKSKLTGSALKPMVMLSLLTPLAAASLALAVVSVLLAVLSCWSESSPEQAVSPAMAVTARRQAANSDKCLLNMLDSLLIFSSRNRTVLLHIAQTRLLLWRLLI